MNSVTAKSVFDLFGQQDDRGTYLSIHGDDVRLYNDGKVYHFDNNAERSGHAVEGFGSYDRVRLPSKMDSLFLLAWNDLKKPAAQVVDLSLVRGSLEAKKVPQRVNSAPSTDDLSSDQRFALLRMLTALFDAVTMPMEIQDPHYPNNPKRTISVRVPKPAAQHQEPCPFCTNGVCMWLGRALLCGSCGGSGKYMKRDDPPPPRSVA